MWGFRWAFDFSISVCSVCFGLWKSLLRTGVYVYSSDRQEARSYSLQGLCEETVPRPLLVTLISQNRRFDPLYRSAAVQMVLRRPA
ncbi:hypothetical protein BDV26DRAFT_181994 [Aspergillus bertholletiae]|uniref:Uncharacterized protein n=1 Tax=Aspergillus bertholletiae TaxID=1226010 RepID=A0A5N7BAV5_9EURO|nr:hypothetical protein BDV26DRAFT_181994 [Aspergillus bertholletiae]